jgi:hypothetical protein
MNSIAFEIFLQINSEYAMFGVIWLLKILGDAACDKIESVILKISHDTINGFIFIDALIGWDFIMSFAN